MRYFLCFGKCTSWCHPANANWRKFIDTGYNRSSDFSGYNRKTHCALSGYNRWVKLVFIFGALSGITAQSVIGYIRWVKPVGCQSRHWHRFGNGGRLRESIKNLLLKTPRLMLQFAELGSQCGIIGTVSCSSSARRIV